MISVPGEISHGRYMSIYGCTRKNAKTRQHSFDLSVAQFAAIVKRSGGKCELSGIVFRATSEFSRNPWIPSLDRIDCKKGYSFKNCRLICAAVNIGLNVWNVSVLLTVADGIRGTLEGHASEIHSSIAEEIRALTTVTAEAEEWAAAKEAILSKTRSSLREKSAKARDTLALAKGSPEYVQFAAQGYITASEVVKLYSTRLSVGRLKEITRAGFGPKLHILEIDSGRTIGRYHIGEVTSWILSGSAGRDLASLGRGDWVDGALRKPADIRRMVSEIRARADGMAQAYRRDPLLSSPAQEPQCTS